jgi:integrase/recombinase XerC
MVNLMRQPWKRPQFELHALRAGATPIDEPTAVFDAMLEAWGRQQASRRLTSQTISGREAMVRRFQMFVNDYPWQWTPGDLEDFTTEISSRRSLAISTIRGYHVAIRLFCAFITDPAYPWARECETRFGSPPAQICTDWNTTAHVSQYEGRAGRRPFTYDELQRFFDVADGRVHELTARGRKGGTAAFRDAVMLKTAYAFGLRRREVVMLDVADMRSNPAIPQWGPFAGVFVRFAKASRGATPRRRTVLAVPEFDWVIEALRQWDHVRENLFPPTSFMWPTERATRVSMRYIDLRFAEIRDYAGLDKNLALHSLRHSYVTHLIEFGYSERFVQEQVGHLYASTTSIYTSVGDDFKAKAIGRAFQRLYGSDEIGVTP